MSYSDWLNWKKIRQAYGLRKVVIIPGDSESSPEVKRELGRAGARTR